MENPTSAHDDSPTTLLTDEPITDPIHTEPNASEEVTEQWWMSPESDGIITGLSAHLADRLGLDPLWVRLVFVVLALLGGLGVLVYTGLWLALIVASDGSRGWARPLGGALIVAGVPLMISGATLNFWTGPFALIALLAGLTFALWRPAPSRGGQPGESLPAPVIQTVAGDAVAVTALEGAGHGTPRRPTVRAARPRREPSILGRMTLGLAVITAAAGALIDELNGGRLHPEQWLGAAAIVCGLGLLVGTVRGSARWLVVPAVCLGIAGYSGGVLARVGITADNVAGDRYLSVYEGAPLRQRAETGFGSVNVNIQQRPESQAVVDVNVGIGEISVSYPDDVTVEVRNDFGDIGVWADGVRETADTFRVGPEGEPDVIINASMQKGRMLVSSFVAYVEPRSDEILNNLVDGNGGEFLSDTYTDEQRNAAIDLVVTRNGATGMTQVADGVQVTNQGWLVLGNSSAVVDDQGNVVLGSYYIEDESTYVIDTDRGPYRIIGPILITPEGDVFDLDTIRAAARTPTADSPVTTVLSSNGAAPLPTVAPLVVEGEG